MAEEELLAKETLINQLLRYITGIDLAANQVILFRHGSGLRSTKANVAHSWPLRKLSCCLVQLGERRRGQEHAHRPALLMSQELAK